jgi:lysophospholipase L1-like esterase
VIGDSFAWGYGVDDDAIFPALLEQRLPATEVINLGVSGYGLHEETAYFRRLGVGFDPDMLIVTLVQNDIVVGQVRGAATPADPAATPTGGPASRFGSIKRRLARSSRLYMLVTDAINANRTLVELAVRLGFKGELGGLSELDFNLMPALREQPAPVRDGWDSTFARLRSLHALTDSLGIRLVIALVPALQAVDRRQLARSLVGSRYWIDDFDMNEPYRRLQQFAATESIDVINPVNAFRLASQARDRLYLNRDMHFSERGHALFASAIVEHLERTAANAAPPRQPRP